MAKILAQHVVTLRDGTKSKATYVDAKLWQKRLLHDVDRLALNSPAPSAVVGITITLALDK